jgi:hypothetical protein
MKEFAVILLGAMLWLHNVQAQKYAPIEDVDLIARYKEVLRQERPHVFDTLQIGGVFPIDSHHAKIVYYEDGIYHEAVVNSGRKDMLLVVTFKEIPLSSLPKIIAKAFEDSKFHGWDIEKVYKARTPYEDWFYALDVTKNREIKRLYYTDIGGYKKPPY